MNRDDKRRALDLLQVSRETSDRLTVFADLLVRWQDKVNLVSSASLKEVWTRHILDSAQLVRLAPRDAVIWADIGSGAGFPGVIVGILLAENPQTEVHLIENDQRKAAFLRVVSRETKAPLVVHCARAENVLQMIPGVQVVTSRATASLAQLLTWTEPLLRNGAVGLFLKGESIEKELTALAPLNSICLTLAPSLTHPSSAIVVARASHPQILP